jgi:hypothetical protein
MKNQIRKVLFTDKNQSLIRTELSLPGNMLAPPSILVFRGKLYHYTGSGMESNFYREIPDSYMFIEESVTQ